MDKRELSNFIDRISLTGPGGIEKVKRVLKEIAESGDVTEEELQEALAEKQDALVSGTNIKTINGQPVLGEGDIAIPQGETGPQGPAGPQGPEGPQGIQGNTGSSVDYPYELVNNRTTNDATKGLSAAEGYRMGQDISQLEAKVTPLIDVYTRSETLDATSYPLRNFSIKTDGTYGTGDSYKHCLVEIIPGDLVKITAPSGTFTRFCFVKSTTAPAGGGAIDLCTGQSCVELSAGTSQTFIAPIDAVAFLFYRGQSPYPSTPDGIVITSAVKPIDNLVSNDGAAPLSANQGRILNEKIDNTSSGLDARTSELEKEVNGNVQNYESGYLKNNGTVQSTQNWIHSLDYIPVTEGDTIVWNPGGTDNSADMVRYDSLKVRNGGWGATAVERTLTVPSGCAYVRPSFRTANTDAKIIVNGVVVWTKVTGYTGILERVGTLESETAGLSDDIEELNSPSSILSWNPEREWIPKMMSAQKRYYTSSDTTEPYPLVIMHLSDIHGNWQNVERFLEFCDKYSTYFDLRINTGDIVSDDYDDGISGYSAITGVEDIVNIIGNHDCSKYEGGVRDWTYYCGLPCYNTFIAPFVSAWGVTQPQDAATNGYCYFYKDYSSKNIRVVFVDIMAYDDTENTWLAGVLADAKSNGYTVVIATHYAGVRKETEQNEAVFVKIPCNYTTLYALGSNSLNLTPYNTSAYKMMVTVDEFMQGGGKFVGYIQGHYHADFIAKCAEFPSQLIFSIGASKAGEFRDYKHTVGTRFQDEFQVISIDTKNTIVKIFKVGANIDRYGRTKGSVCVDYSTGEIVGEGMF